MEQCESFEKCGSKGKKANHCKRRVCFEPQESKKHKTAAESVKRGQLVIQIEQLREAMDAVNHIISAFVDNIGLDINGPLHDAICKIFAVAVLRTAECIGANEDAFEWFVFENNFGREKRESRWPGEKPVIIDSIEAFLAFEGLI